MEQVWAALDIYAHASLIESSPQSILESMSLGLPAVAVAARRRYQEDHLPRLMAQRFGAVIEKTLRQR